MARPAVFLGRPPFFPLSRAARAFAPLRTRPPARPSSRIQALVPKIPWKRGEGEGKIVVPPSFFEPLPEDELDGWEGGE